MEIEELKKLVRGVEEKKKIKVEAEEKKKEELVEGEVAEIKRRILGREKIIITPKNKKYALFIRIFNALSPILSKLSILGYKFAISRHLDRYIYALDIDLTPAQYVAVCTSASFTFGLITFLITLILRFPLQLLILLTLGVYMLTFFLMMNYPKRACLSRARKVDAMLPFALREMATMVSAGVSLKKAMEAVAFGEYGELSREFKRVLRDMEHGESTQDALKKLIARTDSEPLKRACASIVRTLRAGGNLSQILEGIASDVSFELLMRIREFVEKLNIIGTFYVVVGVVFPVLFSIMIALSFSGLPIITFKVTLPLVFFIYFGIIPMLLYSFSFVVRKLQPRV